MIVLTSDTWTLLQKRKKPFTQINRFIITTHVNPDGDGIGSELGLLRFLRRLGKEACIVNSTWTPRKYQFLERPSEIFFMNHMTLRSLTQLQVIFILDISKWERLGPMHSVIQNHPALKICIDHHPLCGDFADINWICQEACASGELVLQLITEMNAPLTTDIAEPLYASILTDTGAFRFPNTNSPDSCCRISIASNRNQSCANL